MLLDAHHVIVIMLQSPSLCESFCGFVNLLMPTILVQTCYKCSKSSRRVPRAARCWPVNHLFIYYLKHNVQEIKVTSYKGDKNSLTEHCPFHPFPLVAVMIELGPMCAQFT